MKILILGHSNSISPNGYIRGLAEQLGGPRLVNYSIGYSPGTQFAYYGALDFSAFDLVIFDSLANDDMYVEDVGGWEFYRDLYYELFSTIASQTRLVIVGFFRRPLDAPVTDAFYLQVDLAALFGATFVDVREFVLEHGPSIVPEGARLMVDEAHPHDAIARELGRHIGRLVAETPAPPRASRNFSANFHGIDAADLFRGEVALRQTRLMTRRLAVLREGDAIEFDREWPVVGFFVDITMTKGFLLLEGDGGTRAKSVIFNDPIEKLQMRFVPLRSPVLTRRLVCTGRCDIFEPTLHSLDARPEYGSPVISLHGIACWSGGSHADLPIKRRGAIAFQPTRRTVRATDDIELPADEMPVGRGWRELGHGSEGVPSRGTGPDTPSVLAFNFEPGRYDIELRVLGAAAPGAVETLSASANDRPLSVETVYDPAAGLFRCWMTLEVERSGPVDLLLTVPQTKDGYGLEVGGIHVRRYDEELSIKRRAALGFRSTRQAVRATEDIELQAIDMPVGRGWRQPGQRPDGAFSRGTGPETPSVLAFDLEPGRYDIELRVLGATAPETLETLSASADGRPLMVETLYDPTAGFFRCWIMLEVDKSGPINLLLKMALNEDGYGIEVAGLRVSPYDEGLAIQRRDAITQTVRRAVRATEDIDLPAPDMPVGRGWREAGQRPDGGFSRGTGPDAPSVLAFDLEPGRYDIELRVLGAVVPEALHSLSASVNGRPLPVETVYDRAADLFRCWMALEIERSGPIDLVLKVPLTEDGFGLEIAGLRVSPYDRDLAIKRRDAVTQTLRRLVRATDDVELLAPDMPVGRGWREAGQRSDGVFSRGTGPDTPSVLAFDLEPGQYDIELRVLGAVVPEVLYALSARADGRPVTVETIYDRAAGLFRCWMMLEVERSGPLDLLLTVPQSAEGYGLEVSGLRVSPHDKLSIKRRDAIAQITRLVVRATDDIEVPALDMPVGRGWREAGPRPDGLSSRGTGPDTPSVLAFDLERGHYDIELRVLGAVTPQALEALSANVDDGPLTIETAYDPVAGFFRSLMSLAVEREGPVDLLLTVPHTKDGYGLEVAGIRVRPHDEESSVKRRATLEFQPTRQVVRATEDVELLATEMPVVRGWRQPGQRPDGSFTRGTGPDTPSVLAFDLERGRYDIELRVLGAVTAEALQTFTASADDRPLTVETIYDPAAKLFRCSMVLEVDRGGPVDLELTVPLTSNGYGLEVGGIRLAGQKSGSTQIERQIIARGLL